MTGKILVAGATGGIGSLIVQQLIDRGEPVCALVRDRQRAEEMFGSPPELIVGDTRKPESLKSALGNVTAVICATGSRAPGSDNSPEQVDFHGVANLVQAAVRAKVDHFVLVSSIAVTKPDHPLNQFGRVLEWKLQGENALRASGLSYTIIRPGGLTNNSGGSKRLLVSQGDHITGMISREDVARLCITALDVPGARRVTLEVVETKGEPIEDFSQYFAGLSPDKTLNP